MDLRSTSQYHLQKAGLHNESPDHEPGANRTSRRWLDGTTGGAAISGTIWPKRWCYSPHYFVLTSEEETLMKRATVYRRGAVILIHPSSCTTDGVWILSKPCVRLSSDCGDAEMGSAVLSALEGSKLSVPHPTQWKGLLEPLLMAAGVKAWKTFVKSAVCVEVEQQNGQLEFIPTVNLGSDEGFQANKSKQSEVVLPARSDVVGAVLRGALASSH